MTNITASMVKDLREKTGAGMMDCKKALAESAGDMEAAVDWLRTKSLATVAKKASRVAAEGLVGVCSQGAMGAVVEVNSETDFVARNESFQNMVGEISRIALAKDGDAEAITAAAFPGAGKSVAEHLSAMVATIGENMNLRRAAFISVGQGVVASYVHNQAGPGLGRIGVLVALESAGDADKLATFGKQVAMHVAATSPLAVTSDELDPAVVERERAILAEQARESGKPEEIISKMVDGRMRKFYEESVLLSQTFVIDGENTVDKAVKAAEAEIGAPIKITGFVRFALGEGIDKEESDFAAEVAATAAGA
jgi:elongation factor Ts